MTIIFIVYKNIDYYIFKKQGPEERQSEQSHIRSGYILNALVGEGQRT